MITSPQYSCCASILAMVDLISPISQLDYPKIFEMTEDAFTKYIISQKTFDNLIEHTLKHNKNDKIEKDSVIESYKKLICEYYNIVKAKPQVGAE